MDVLDDLEELLDDYNMELFLGISQSVDPPDRQLQPSPQPPASPSAGSLDTLLAQVHHFQGQLKQAGFEPSTQTARNSGAPPPAPPEQHAVTAATPTPHPHRHPHQDANDGSDDIELQVDTLPSVVRFQASSDDLGAFQKQPEKDAGSLTAEEIVSPLRLHRSSDELVEAFPRQPDQGAGSLAVEEAVPSPFRLHRSSDELVEAFPRQLDQGAGSLAVEAHVSPFGLHRSSDELVEAFPRQLDRGAGSLVVEETVPSSLRFRTSSDELVEAFRGQPLETLPGSLTSTRAGGSLELIEADPPSLRSATLSSALSLAGEGEDEDEDGDEDEGGVVDSLLRALEDVREGAVCDNNDHNSGVELQPELVEASLENIHDLFWEAASLPSAETASSTGTGTGVDPDTVVCIDTGNDIGTDTANGSVTGTSVGTGTDAGAGFGAGNGICIGTGPDIGTGTGNRSVIGTSIGAVTDTGAGFGTDNGVCTGIGTGTDTGTATGTNTDTSTRTCTDTGNNIATDTGIATGTCTGTDNITGTDNGTGADSFVVSRPGYGGTETDIPVTSKPASRDAETQRSMTPTPTFHDIETQTYMTPKPARHDTETQTCMTPTPEFPNAETHMTPKPQRHDTDRQTSMTAALEFLRDTETHMTPTPAFHDTETRRSTTQEPAPFHDSSGTETPESKVSQLGFSDVDTRDLMTSKSAVGGIATGGFTTRSMELGDDDLGTLHLMEGFSNVGTLNFEALTPISGFNSFLNDALKPISGFDSFLNDAMTSTSGFDSLQNDAMTSMSGFDSLQNYAMTSISGFDSLQNDAMTSTSGLNSLQQAGVMTSRSRFDSLQQGDVRTQMFASNNMIHEATVSGSMSRFESLQSGEITLTSGLDSLHAKATTSMSGLDSLHTNVMTSVSGCDSLHTNVTTSSVSGHDSLHTNVTTSVSGLNNLHTKAMTSVSGLDSLHANVTTSVSGLNNLHTKAMTSVSGHDSLHTNVTTSVSGLKNPHTNVKTSTATDSASLQLLPKDQARSEPGTQCEKRDGLAAGASAGPSDVTSWRVLASLLASDDGEKVASGLPDSQANKTDRAACVTAAHLPVPQTNETGCSLAVDGAMTMTANPSAAIASSDSVSCITPVCSDNTSDVTPFCTNSISDVTPFCTNSTSDVTPFCTNTTSDVTPFCTNTTGDVTPLCTNSTSDVTPFCTNNASDVTPFCTNSTDCPTSDGSCLAPVCNDNTTCLTTLCNDNTACLTTTVCNDNTTCLATVCNDSTTCLTATVCNDSTTCLTATVCNDSTTCLTTTVCNDNTTCLATVCSNNTTCLTTHSNDNATCLTTVCNDNTACLTTLGNDNTTCLTTAGNNDVSYNRNMTTGIGSSQTPNPLVTTPADTAPKASCPSSSSTPAPPATSRREGSESARQSRVPHSISDPDCQDFVADPMRRMEMVTMSSSGLCDSRFSFASLTELLSTLRSESEFDCLQPISQGNVSRRLDLDPDPDSDSETGCNDGEIRRGGLSGSSRNNPLASEKLGVSSQGDGSFPAKQHTATKPEEKVSGAGRVPSQKMLPPCRVCAQPASGIHYGVKTCEACKGFFRRSLVRTRPYKCKANDKCYLRQTQRSVCASCRYKRCLQVGMSPESIKTGRYSHELRTQNTLEARMLRLRSANLASRTAISDCDLDELVARLMQADRCVLTNTDVPDEVIDHWSRQVHDRRELQDETETPAALSQSEHERFYLATGVDLDGRKPLMETYARWLDRNIRCYVHFIRGIPDFLDLSLNDQASLLKRARAEFWFLGAYRGFRSRYGTFYAPNGVVLSRRQNRHLVGDDVCERQFRVAEKLRRWSVTREELVLLKAVCLTCTDQCRLEDPGKVQGIQDYLLQALLQLLKRRGHGDGGGGGSSAGVALARALDVLVALRELAEADLRSHRRVIMMEVLRDRPLLMQVLFGP